MLLTIRIIQLSALFTDKSGLAAPAVTAEILGTAVEAAVLVLIPLISLLIVLVEAKKME